MTYMKTMEEIYQGIKIKYPEITIHKVMEVILELQMKNILKEESGYYGLRKTFI